MSTEPAPEKRKPLTAHELPIYLLWRYNAGGYDDHIDAWRESLKPKTAGARASANDD